MILISIISITYNDLTGLRKTIESIDGYFSSSERLNVVEHVIIDGNSMDGTKDYLQQTVGFRKIQTNYISESDEGIYDAMNKGVCQSTGQFVVFLNSGDEIFSTHNFQKLCLNLESIVNSQNEAGLALASIIKFSFKTIKINSRKVLDLSPRMPTVHQSMFFKRSVLQEFPFDNTFKICGDYDNFAKIFSKGLHFRTSTDVFSVFYAGGVSSKSPIKLFFESSKITKKYFSLNLYRRIIVMVRLLFSLTIFQLLLLVYGIK